MSEPENLSASQTTGLQLAAVCGLIVIFILAATLGNAKNTKSGRSKNNRGWAIYIVGAFLFGISILIIWWLIGTRRGKDGYSNSTNDFNTGFSISILSIWFIFLLIMAFFNALFSLYSYFYLRNREFEKCLGGEYRNVPISLTA